MKIIVVGAGLFGSIAARLAEHAGHKVTVVDCARPWAASKASGCVMAPSWATSLSGEELQASGRVLKTLFPIHPLSFKTHFGATFHANRVDLKDVLREPELKEEVLRVSDGEVFFKYRQPLKADMVLVAAGVESFSLLNPEATRGEELRGMWGASVLFQRDTLEAPRLHVYAPYRQAVAYQLRKNIVWMGDGTSLIQKTWEKEGERRQQETVERGRKLFGLNGGPVKVLVGARPSVVGRKNGLFKQVDKRTWVATGGAKNGTLLAALYAEQFVRSL